MCVTPHQEKLQCDNNHNQKSSGITQEKKSNMDSKQQQDQRASQLKSSKYDLGQMDNGFYKVHESIIKLQQEAFSFGNLLNYFLPSGFQGAPIPPSPHQEKLQCDNNHNKKKIKRGFKAAARSKSISAGGIQV